MFCAPIDANHSNQCQYHGNPRQLDVDARIKYFVKGIFAAFIAKVSFSLHPAAFSVIGLPLGIIASIYAIHSLSIALLPCAYSNNRIFYIEYWEPSSRVRIPYIRLRNIVSWESPVLTNARNFWGNGVSSRRREQVGSRAINQREVTPLNQSSSSRSNFSSNASPVPASVYRYTKETNAQSRIRREQVGSRAINQRMFTPLNQSSSSRSNFSSNASPVPANVYSGKVRRSDNVLVGSPKKRNYRGRAPVGSRG